MAATNSFDSNFTRMLIRIFLEKFETNRVLTKSVNTQLLSGKFNPATGDKVDFKRPTDYVSVRSATGDVSAATPTESDIITGKATGEVQPYFTVNVEFSEADQSIKMDQLEELLAPAATRLVTDFELDFAQFMVKNTALTFGTYKTAVSTWSHVADTGAFMKSMGVPQDDMWMYVLNPFVQTKLADTIRSLGAGGVAGKPIENALERAVLTDNFAGFRVLDATTLATVSIGAADRTGAINGTPASTYLAAKDKMTVTINVDGLTNGQIYKAGEQISVSTPPNRFNLSTRKLALDAAGAKIPWIGTLTKDTAPVATLATDIEVTGPPIFEANGQYNTVDSVLADGDVVTFRGVANDVVQPNMFFHKQAFGIGSVPMKKLFATDTIGTTEDGMQIRVTRFADGIKNLQRVRFDLRPAYAVLNPFFAGQGFGS